jgi:hypothetical protein
MSVTALVRMAEEMELRAESAIASERAPTEELHAALVETFVCWEDRKRVEQTLESVRRKENGAIERLQELLRAEQKPTPR